MDESIRDARTSRRGLLLASAAFSLGAVAAPAAAQTPGCPEDTLDRIQRTGTFNLGVRDSAPPYGFKDAGGQYTGFATEMARAIYDAVNKELGGSIQLALIPVTSQTRVPLLQNGTIDMEAGASVVTQGRSKVVDFIIPHFLTATGLLVPADSPIKSFADMSGKRIGVPQGGLEEAAYRDINAKKLTPSPIRTIGFPDHAQGVTALQTGTIDGYSSDEPILYGFGTDRAKWRVVSININSFQQAFLIRPASSKFKRIADVTLANLFASGQWNALFEKYFGPTSQTPLALTDQLKTLVMMNSWPA
jgi:glutamate/aspartate transport system substrate-binding protein